MEDIVASIKAGYECGKKHNIIVLAEGVMSAAEFGQKNLKKLELQATFV